MRVSRVILFAAALLCAAEAKTKIAVMDFGGMGVALDEAESFTESYRSALAASGAFTVVSRSAMRSSFESKGFTKPACGSVSCLVEAGSAAGVEQMVGGIVSKSGNEYTITVQVADVAAKTQVCKTTTKATGGFAEVIDKAPPKAVRQMLAALGSDAAQPAENAQQPAAATAPPRDTATQKAAKPDSAAAARKEAAKRDSVAAAQREAAKRDSIAAAKKETARRDSAAAAQREAAKRDSVATAKREAAKRDSIATAQREAAKRDSIAAAKKETARRDSAAAAQREAAKRDSAAAARKEAARRDSAAAARQQTSSTQPASSATAPGASSQPQTSSQPGSSTASGSSSPSSSATPPPAQAQTGPAEEPQASAAQQSSGTSQADRVMALVKERVNVGIQIANDISFLTPPGADEYQTGPLMAPGDDEPANYIDNISKHSATGFLADRIGFTNTYWVRVDAWANISITDATTVYNLISLRALGLDSGKPENFSYTVLNCELEHYFSKLVRARVGRLVSKYSESIFFGRMVLGKGDAHVFGRTPLINDALEVSLLPKPGTASLEISVGAKPQFNPMDLYSIYGLAMLKAPAGKNQFKLVGIYNFVKQQGEEAAPFLLNADPLIDRSYQGVEGEASMGVGGGALTAFVNAGTLINYIGPMPKCSGPRDILKGNEPPIYDSTKSAGETMTGSAGVYLRPGFLNEKLKFVKLLGGEFEIVGLGNPRVKVYNSYLTAKAGVWRLMFDYALQVNLARYEMEHTFEDSKGKFVLAASELNNFVHYLRLSIMFGSLGTRAM